MTDAEAVVAARILITEKSESTVDVTLPRLTGLIPTALYEFRKWIRNSPKDRPLIEETITLTFSSGTCDLASYVNGTTKNLDLRDIGNTILYTGSPAKPMTWMGSRAQIQNARQLDSESVAIYMDGKTLRTRNTDGSLTTFATTATFQGVNYPLTVATLPAQCEEQFVQLLARLVLEGAS